MDEYLHQLNMCGGSLTIAVLERFLFQACLITDMKPSALKIISHLIQKDIYQALLPKVCLNDYERTEAKAMTAIWMDVPAMPQDEIRVETPKGVCRLYNLNVYCQSV